MASIATLSAPSLTFVQSSLLSSRALRGTQSSQSIETCFFGEPRLLWRVFSPSVVAGISFVAAIWYAIHAEPLLVYIQGQVRSSGCPQRAQEDPTVGRAVH